MRVIQAKCHSPLAGAQRTSFSEPCDSHPVPTAASQRLRAPERGRLAPQGAAGASAFWYGGFRERAWGNGLSERALLVAEAAQACTGQAAISGRLVWAGSGTPGQKLATGCLDGIFILPKFVKYVL